MKINRRTTLIFTARFNRTLTRPKRLVGSIRSRRLSLYWAGRLAVIVARAW